VKKYDVFLFDADNTLFDYDLAEKNALSIMMERHGLGYSEEIRDKYREINADVWGKFERGEITKTELQSSRFELLFRHMEANINIDGVAFNDGYIKHLGEGSYLIDGAYEICKDIVKAGKKLYIITNGLLATQEARIKHSTISKYISDSFISEVVGYEKPHIRFFEHVISSISPPIPKDKIIIIGDYLKADIAGGINIGIDTCWFNLREEENKTEIKPTYEIKKLNELHKFI